MLWLMEAEEYEARIRLICRATRCCIYSSMGMGQCGRSDANRMVDVSTNVNSIWSNSRLQHQGKLQPLAAVDVLLILQ